MTAAAECSSSTENWTLGVAEQNVSVDVVLLRARERVKAPGWPVHGDQEVAAGGGLGLPWRARVRPGRERKEVETGKG
jgi:hypothetical protein